MNVKKTFEKYFSLTFTNHILAIINFISFVMICFISFALDVVSPFNKINIILVGVFIFTTLAFLVVNKIKPRLSIFTICVVGIIACMLISFVANGFNSFPKTPLLMCVLSFFVYLWFDANRKILNFYLFGLLIASYLFLITFFVLEFSSIIHPNFSSRIGSSLGNQNDVARHLVFAFAINCYYIYSFKNKLLIILSSILSVVSFYFVFLTGSISNLLVLSLLTIGLIVYMAKGRRKLFAIIGIVATIIVFIILLQLPFMAYFKTRIENMVNTITTGSGSVDHSFIDRFNLAIYGLRLFTSKPLFGYGYDQVQFYTWGKDAFSHNNFVELLASFGIIGFIIFEFLLLFPIYKCWKKEGKEITVFLLLYLFAFQLFLIIYRKKIEYFLIPLSFSFVEPKLNGISIAIKKGRIEISKTGADRKKEPESYYSINI